jgi:16S rRNA (uracil1498-N3)-methyltransferase
MRAHWVKDLIKQDSYVLKDEALHHLVNVIRIESGEDLLLINGSGFEVLTTVESISKRELRLTYKSSLDKQRAFHFDVAIGMPKREALELCLKQATELGFRKIFLIKSDYSQMRFPEADRMEKLLISALEQSNAPFMPEIIETTWETLPFTEYAQILLLDSQTKINTKNVLIDRMASRLLVVGPEGGFSPQELESLHAKDNVKVVNLPTPILRTPTALAAGAGIMIESLLK